jgi:hypothetical protein
MSLLSSLVMDVFVIPIGREKYELYCEQPAAADITPDEAPKRFVDRLRHKFKVLLRDAEERRRSSPDVDHQDKGRIARLQDHAMAWVAERIEEQRLLWNLRGQTTAVAAHPQDMTFEQVMTLIRGTLKHDYERHRRWVVIDGITFLLTFVLLGPLFFLIPGVANLPAAYFAFRTVGHFLSMRGARHGLEHVEWASRPCPPLTELRDIEVLEPRDRHQRIHDIAARLRLQHLSTFFERVAIHA